MNGKRFIADVKGVGIKAVTREYYMSSSSTEQKDGAWSTTVPTLGDNKYLWYRDVFTLTNDKTAITAPLCDGVWEEIYEIYDINTKVSGYVADVETVKTDMNGVKTDVEAIQAKLKKGIVKINAEDVTADTYNAWVKLGNSGDCYLNFDGAVNIAFTLPDACADGGVYKEDTSGVLVSLKGSPAISDTDIFVPAIHQTYYSKTGIWYRTITQNSVGAWGQGEWQDIGVISKGTWETLQYKQFGNKITINGYATSLAWSGSSGDQVAHMADKASLAPKETVYFYGFAKTSIVRLYITSKGEIGIDWRRSVEDNSKVTTGSFCKFSVEYYI